MASLLLVERPGAPSSVLTNGSCIEDLLDVWDQKKCSHTPMSLTHADIPTKRLLGSVFPVDAVLFLVLLSPPSASPKRAVHVQRCTL